MEHRMLEGGRMLTQRDEEMHALAAQLVDLLQRREVEVVIAAIFHSLMKGRETGRYHRPGADRKTH